MFLPGAKSLTIDGASDSRDRARFHLQYHPESRPFRPAFSLSKRSFLSIFGCCCTPVLLRKPLENCLRAVRHGPHFVQSTKPQFSEVSAFRKGRRCTATENRRTTCEKARFTACGKCRPSRTAGKRFFRCPDEIWTPGLMPLPVPRFFEKIE